MSRLLLGCLIASAASLLGLGLVSGAHAQGNAPAITLEADHSPLSEILRELGRQSGVDIVFAERTIAGKAVTGRYIGDDVEGALRTVLRGSGLRAEQVRARQYVIVPEGPPGLGVSSSATLRGTLEGVVVDAETGEALPGAHVLLFGLGLGAVTNTAGYFAIPRLPSGDYPVRVSFVGYRTAEVELPVYPSSKLDRPTIRLLPEPHTSAAVVVEGSDRVRSDLEILPGNARVGVRAASALPAMLGDGDLFSALEWVPGVVRTGEAGGELVVRGAEAQYNRYLLDGAPVIHPWHTFGLFSIFQPEALRSVQLHKGSFPAEHGGALSAVIDLEMRDGERGRPGGMVAISPVSLRGVAEAPITDRLSLMVTARRTWLDLLLTPRLRLTSNGGLPSFAFQSRIIGDGGPDDQDIGYHFYDVGSKLTYRLAQGHRLSLSIYDGGDRLQAEAPLGTLTGSSGEGSEDQPQVGLAYAWGNRVVSTRYHGLVRSDLFVTATGYYSGYRARERSTRLPNDAGAFETDYRLRVAEAGLRLDADFYHSFEHQLRAGVQLTGRDFASTFHEELVDDDAIIRRDQLDRVRAVEVAAYLQDTWQPAAGWQLQPGLRVEYFGLGGYLSLNPRFHLRHALQRDRIFLRAGVSRQTQPLHRLRDHGSHTYDLAADRWLPASDRIRPASAWQVAAGLEWLPNGWLTLSAETFGRRLADILLPPDPQPPADFTSTQAAPFDDFVAGKGRGAGIELAATAELQQGRAGIAYSFSRTQEQVPGSPYRPARYDAPHQVEAFGVGHVGSFTVSVAGVLRSGYPTTIPALFAGPIEAGARDNGLHNGRLPTYARLDLSVAYAFSALGLDWNAQAQAYNLLNRRNTVGMQHAPEIAVASETDVHGLPMLPMISLRARW